MHFFRRRAASILAAVSLATGCSGATTTNLDLSGDGGGGTGSSGGTGTGGSSGGTSSGGSGGGTSSGGSSGGSSSSGSSGGRSSSGGSSGSTSSGGSGGGSSGGHDGGDCAGACDSGVDAAPSTCTTDSDCGSGRLCEFKITEGCSAAGRCFTPPPPGPICNAYSAACSCSGQTINVICTIYTSGYAALPIAYHGACEASAVDAGAVDAGAVDAGAGTFTCGDGTCPATQVCKVGMGGAAGTPTSYTCVDYPSQCASTHTCACAKTALGAQECSEAGGDVTATFLYP